MGLVMRRSEWEYTHKILGHIKYVQCSKNKDMKKFHTWMLYYLRRLKRGVDLTPEYFAIRKRRYDRRKITISEKALMFACAWWRR